MISISITAKVTVIVALALLATRLTASMSASRRALILTAALLSAATLSAADALLPRVPMILAPMPAVSEVLRRSPVQASGTTLRVLEPPRAAALEPHAWPGGLATMVGAVWAIGVAIALAPLVFTMVNVQRVRQRARRLPESLRPLVDGQSLNDLDIRVSEEIDVPMVVGLRRPTMLLPGPCLEWPVQHLANAMVHEREHIRRGDLLAIPLNRVAVALHWFNPLIWMAWRQFRLEAERACDDAVVAGGGAVTYAEQLVTLARHVSSARARPVVAMAARTDLSARVTSVLDPGRPRHPVSTRGTKLVLAAAAIGAIAVAPVTVVVAEQRVIEEPRSASLTTGPRGNVAGVVYDPTGLPLAGLLLILEQNCYGPNARNCGFNSWTRTDRQGRFRFDGLPVGSFHVTSPIDFFPGLQFSVIDGQTVDEDITMTISPVEGEFTVCAECAELVVPDSLAKEFAADRVDALDHPVSAPHPASGWEFYKPANGEYPAALKEAGVEGSVVVEGRIGVDGVPTAMKAEPPSALGRAAMAGLAGEIWEPGRIRGIAVEVPFRLLVRYVLKD